MRERKAAQSIDERWFEQCTAMVPKVPIQKYEASRRFQGEKTMNTVTTKIILLTGIGALTMLPGAKADQWNQKTVLTLNSPVEIPGQILPAGTYVFKLAGSQSNRHIVQVFNQNEDRVLGTFLAIPTHRRIAGEKPIVRFHERPAGSPQAIKAWFYPGRTTGHEFVYPKKEAIELAKANNEPVPAMPAELSTTTTMSALDLKSPEIAEMTTAPLIMEEPSGREVLIAALYVSAPKPAPAPELPEELPHTASWMALVGLVGLMSLSAAGVLRFRAASTK
jgi:hypothetical protein